MNSHKSWSHFWGKFGVYMIPRGDIRKAVGHMFNMIRMRHCQDVGAYTQSPGGPIFGIVFFAIPAHFIYPLLRSAIALLNAYSPCLRSMHARLCNLWLIYGAIRQNRRRRIPVRPRTPHRYRCGPTCDGPSQKPGTLEVIPPAALDQLRENCCRDT